MSFEKKYNEALERAKKLGTFEMPIDPKRSVGEQIFPELAQSKDERIRKAILELVKQSSHILNPMNQKSMIAWLEKQGKKSNIPQSAEDELRRQHIIQKLEYLRSLDACNKYGKENINKDIAWLEKKQFNTDIEQVFRPLAGCDIDIAAKQAIEQQKQGKNVVLAFNGCYIPVKDDTADAIVKKYNTWLKKQGTARQLYVRFGDVPSNEKSKIYRGEEGEIGEENGVSVYPAFEVNGNVVLGLTLPITKTTLYTQQHLLEYDDRPCYLVSGDCVGKGADGEPLIRNVSIVKQLDKYRIKESIDKVEPKFHEGDMIIHKELGGDYIHNPHKIIQVDMLDKKYRLEGGFVAHFSEQDDYELIEQKPAQNPKFKVGDWCIDNEDGTIFQIVKVLDNTYTYKTNEGKEYSCSHYSLENDARLWTIQDAKDGDVLVFDDIIMIFKNIHTVCTANTYILYCDGIVVDVWCDFGYDARPATKEQRDTLFAKIHEAGYEWNPEKKELKRKPKFEVDDWIVRENNEIKQIEKITDLPGNHYQYWTTDGRWFGDATEARLWTIQNAKDGDVLVIESGRRTLECLFIFKDIANREVLERCYYRISDNTFSPTGSYIGYLDNNYHPATKEQRDLLFSKMKEAGYEWNEDKKELKKIEQESANKCEPNFKVGDWIITPSNEIKQIKEVTFGNYWFTDGTLYNIIDVDNKGHLWTIQNAKDGDVLCGYPTDTYPWIGIFHELNDDYAFSSYCYLQAGITGKFCPPSGVNIFNRRNVDEHSSKNVVPATKEQRDILFQKMKEAGYKWDTEKKELRKIEEENEDDYCIAMPYGIDDLSTELDIPQKTSGRVDGYQSDDGILEHQCAISAVKELSKQKPAWSEEDESNLQGIMDEIEANKHSAPDYDLATYDRFLSWLKSLKERYTWKPSEEQIEMLENIRKILHNKDIYSKSVHLMYDFEELIRTLNKQKA